MGLTLVLLHHDGVAPQVEEAAPLQEPAPRGLDSDGAQPQVPPLLVHAATEDAAPEALERDGGGGALLVPLPRRDCDPL